MDSYEIGSRILKAFEQAADPDTGETVKAGASLVTKQDIQFRQVAYGES